MISLAKIILVATLIASLIIIAIFLRLMLEDSEAIEIDIDEFEKPELSIPKRRV